MKINLECQASKKLLLNEKTRTHFVDIKDISHLSCEGYLTIIHINSKQITISKQLKMFEDELSGLCFFRVNRNTIINLTHTKMFCFKPSPFIELNNGCKFRISRRRISKIKDHLKSEYVS